MKKSEKPFNLSSRVYVHSDSHTDKIFNDLQVRQHDVQRTVRLLDRICSILLKHVLHHIGRITPSVRNVVPVYILRGGLIMLHAFQRISPYTRFGLMLPYRPTQEANPEIAYGEIPQLEPNEKYLLLDLIINTGATICACLENILQAVNPIDSSPIIIASPFVTELATSRILNKIPNVQIHTIWHQMVRGPDGWLIGLEFDGGDYACGGGPRIRLCP